ncbi:MAG: GTP-binding protein [Anaerolineales bacterium]|nr:GTP-binding protein [Anaerolineales bacterium]
MTPSIQPTTAEKMDIVFVGHVDHGKSTVIGRMLADTGSLPEGKLEQVQLSCERNSKPFEYAYLIDALKDERAQSITIDSARVFFQSLKRHYIIIDAPGHIEFIKNMVTGASRAEAAVLVIDAHEGIQENSRRHGYLLWMLGIKQIVVAVNKMDLVDYDQDVFDTIETEYNSFLAEIGVEPLCTIPVSGREGDNVASLSERMPWYQGHTVLSALDSFTKARPLDDKPMRLPVQDVYKFTLFGDDRRIVAGTLSSGKLKSGDEIIFYPSGKRSTIKTLEEYGAPAPEEARAGEAVGFTMEEQIYVRRGQVACLASEPAPQISQRFRASLFWLGKHPMLPKKQYLLKLGTERVKAEIETIHAVIDASDLSNKEKQVIEHHDVAEVTFLLKREMAFDTTNGIPDTSRFVVVDDYEIWGGGIVLEAIGDAEQTILRDEVFLRNKKWIKSHISYDDRADRYNQHSALIIVTGKKGSGRKTLAGKIEKQLFDDGKFVYYLGVGSVLYGVNADLKRDGRNNWHEHLRRIGEIANIFLDAGLILILTAIELTQDDLKVIQTIISSNQIETAWVGDTVTTDINYDILIPDEQRFDEATISIKRLLQEHGIIFSP